VDTPSRKSPFILEQIAHFVTLAFCLSLVVQFSKSKHFVATARITISHFIIALQLFFFNPFNRWLYTRLTGITSYHIGF
ncbi:hypothetical protein ACFFNY_33795, partial [Paenibacillus hodogayensis]